MAQSVRKQQWIALLVRAFASIGAPGAPEISHLTPDSLVIFVPSGVIPNMEFYCSSKEKHVETVVSKKSDFAAVPFRCNTSGLS